MKVYIMGHNHLKNLSAIQNYFKDKNDIIFKEYLHNSSDYINFANDVIISKNSRGIIFSTYGIDAFLTTSKIKNVRSVIAVDEFISKYSVAHNNVQIAILPLSIISEEYGLLLIDIFLNTKFEGGRHNSRIDLLENLKQE